MHNANRVQILTVRRGEAWRTQLLRYGLNFCGSLLRGSDEQIRIEIRFKSRCDLPRFGSTVDGPTI